MFEQEREHHDAVKANKVETLHDVQKRLYATMYDSGSGDKHQSMLISPKQRRQDIHEIRDKLVDVAQFKQQHRELARRDRVFKTAWRHGITGIDNADSANASVFYQDEKARRDFIQKEKDTVNNKRKDSKLTFSRLSELVRVSLI